MKEFISKIIFIATDLFAILLSVSMAHYLRATLPASLFTIPYDLPLEQYLHFYPLYLIVLAILGYEGIYTHRYDFWHETKLVIKGLVFSLFIVLAYLAISKTIDDYSRFVLVLSFLLMAFFLPMFKRIVKTLLFRYGIWKKPVYLYANDPFLRKELLETPYLGYRAAESPTETQSVFINTSGDLPRLRKLIEKELKNNHEINFIPLMNDYDLTQSHIYGLFNTRTNLVVLQNRLRSKYRQWMHLGINYLFAFLLMPLLLPLLGTIGVLIKLESPGPIFFRQKRVGKGGKTFYIYKFRSMYIDADTRLKEILRKDPRAREEWRRTHKLKEDPRITKIGHFIRKTSLDELPQLINILKGEMSFVGPRPVTQEEIDKFYGENAEYYYMVKPGITGLWQVSGRNDISYEERVCIDRWYVVNWSLWLDIVIFFKTLKVVLKKEGAY